MVWLRLCKSVMLCLMVKWVLLCMGLLMGELVY